MFAAVMSTSNQKRALLWHVATQLVWMCAADVQTELAQFRIVDNRWAAVLRSVWHDWLYTAVTGVLRAAIC